MGGLIPFRLQPYRGVGGFFPPFLSLLSGCSSHTCVTLPGPSRTVTTTSDHGKKVTDAAWPQSWGERGSPRGAVTGKSLGGVELFSPHGA